MNRVKENMIWNAVGSLIYLGGQWVLTILVVRVLGYKDAGVLSLAMSLTNTFYSLANYGIRNFQVSDLKGQFSDREYIYNRAITSMIAFVGCSFYCWCQGYNHYSCIAILWFMLFRICEAFQDVLYGVQQKNSDMRSIGMSNVLKGIIGTVIFFLILLLSKKLNYALFAMFLVILLVLIFFDSKRTNRYIGNNEEWQLKNSWVILLICAPIALNNFMSNYILTYPKLIIEKVMGEEALGIYSSIATPVLVVQMAASYVFAPLIVIFAQYYKEKKFNLFLGLFMKVIGAIFLLGIMAFIGAKMGGEIFLRLMFGESIVKYVYIIYPLIVCTVLTAIVWFFNAILIVCRDYWGLCISCIVSLFILFFISNKMVEQYSYNGASYALCIALVMRILIMIRTFVKRIIINN